jgi:glyoxylate reductase
MSENKRFRVFATSRIGEACRELFRERGYELEVFQGPESPPKKLIIEKVKSGIDGLITTLRDPIDAEVFEAGKGTLKVVAQIAVGFDNINRSDANKYKIPFTNTADVLTEATAEFAFFMMACLRANVAKRALGARTEMAVVAHVPVPGDEITGKTIAASALAALALR